MMEFYHSYFPTLPHFLRCFFLTFFWRHCDDYLKHVLVERITAFVSSHLFAHPVFPFTQSCLNLCFGSHFRCHFLKEASFDTSSTLSSNFPSEYLQLVITVYGRNKVFPQECRFHEGRDCSCFVATDNLPSTVVSATLEVPEIFMKESKQCCITPTKQYSLNA